MSWLRRIHAFLNAPDDPRPLALTRVAIAVVLLADLLLLFPDLARVLWDPVAFDFADKPTRTYVLDSLVGPSGGMVAYAITIASLLCVAGGVGVRPALIVAVLAYAQLGHLTEGADRGIDRILRTAMLFLAFSGSHHVLSPWGTGALAKRWTDFLLRWLLMFVYLGAGVIKLMAGGWFALDGRNQLYRILVNPMASSLDSVTWEPYTPLFVVGSAATIIIELAVPLILVRRIAPFWAAIAIWIHLGIAALMYLGMFSFGMVAFYPLLFWPWLKPFADRYWPLPDAR